MTKDQMFASFNMLFKEYIETAAKACKGDENITQDKIDTFALVMTMSSLYENRIAGLEAEVKKLAGAVGKVGLSVENLALQATNNQAEMRRTLDAIKTGVLDTNLAVKFPEKR